MTSATMDTHNSLNCRRYSCTPKMKILVIACFAILASALAEEKHPALQKLFGNPYHKRPKCCPWLFLWQISLQWGWAPYLALSHSCRGALITNEWVLTAGHCFTGVPSFGTHRVIAGKHVIDRNEPTQESSVASGWGSTSFTSIPIMPTVLQTVTVPIIPNTECFEIFASLVSTDIPLQPKNICTGDVGDSRISMCSGDSGGPLIQEVGGVWEHVGIVSWGLNPCESPVCFYKNCLIRSLNKPEHC